MFPPNEINKTKQNKKPTGRRKPGCSGRENERVNSERGMSVVQPRHREQTNMTEMQ